MELLFHGAAAEAAYPVRDEAVHGEVACPNDPGREAVCASRQGREAVCAEVCPNRRVCDEAEGAAEAAYGGQRDEEEESCI